MERYKDERNVIMIQNYPIGRLLQETKGLSQNSILDVMWGIRRSRPAQDFRILNRCLDKVVAKYGIQTGLKSLRDLLNYLPHLKYADRITESPGDGPQEKDEEPGGFSCQICLYVRIYVCIRTRVCIYLTEVVVGRLFEVSCGIKPLKVKNQDY